MYQIGRHINNITLNDYEYILDGEGGNVLEFESAKKAVDWLNSQTGETLSQEDYEEDYGYYVMPVRKIDKSSIVLGGVDGYDHPDYSDAYVQSAEWEDGTPLTHAELDALDSDLIYTEIARQTPIKERTQR